MNSQANNQANDERGRRAEDVATWYFRLNGFLSLPGFIVHPDQPSKHPRTEADLLGVRFPHSREFICERQMEDDGLLTRLDPTGSHAVFILVEVKADRCKINGPWSDQQSANMQRVIRRLGFAGEHSIDKIAAQMYESARWENTEYVLQYICVGRVKKFGLQNRFPHLCQIDWGEIAAFLWSRFEKFPEKLPDGKPVHHQWPDFGRKYGEWFKSNMENRHDITKENHERSYRAIMQFIKTGNCSDKSAVTPHSSLPAVKFGLDTLG